MSTSTTDSTQNGEQPTSRQASNTQAYRLKRAEDWDKIIRQQALIRQAHEGVMLEKMMRQQVIVEQDAKNAVTGEAGTEMFPEEDMAVSIGNVYNFGGTQSEQPQPEPPPSTSPSPTPQPPTPPQQTQPQPQPSTPTQSQANNPWKAIALGLAGAGLVGGGTLLGSWLAKPDPPQQPQPPQQEFIDTDTDTDTWGVPGYGN